MTGCPCTRDIRELRGPQRLMGTSEGRLDMVEVHVAVRDCDVSMRFVGPDERQVGADERDRGADERHVEARRA